LPHTPCSAFHQGRDISPILLRQIARDIGMTGEEFVAVEA
jgi:hypothetical protein